MVESMSATAERIFHYEQVHGKQEVEEFLDAILAVQEHVDPYRIPQSKDEGTGVAEKKKSTPYDDLWDVDRDVTHSGVKKKKKNVPRTA